MATKGKLNSPISPITDPSIMSAGAAASTGKLLRVLPTLHPSFLIRGGWAWRKTVAEDLAKAKALAEGSHEEVLGKYSPHWEGVPPVPAGEIAVDLETLRDRYQITQVNWSCRPGEGTAGWYHHQRVQEELRRICGDGRPLVFHNAAFDVDQLRAAGIPVKGPVFDTMIAAAILEPDLPNNLEAVAKDFLGMAPWKYLAGSDLPLYGCIDADATMRLRHELQRLMDEEGVAGCFKTSMEVQPLLFEMWWNGLRINVDRMREMADECWEQEVQARAALDNLVRDMPTRRERLLALEEGIEALVAGTQSTVGRDRVTARKALGDTIEGLRGILFPNWGSYPQVLEIVRQMGMEPPINKDTKRPTIDAAAIREMARQHPKNSGLLALLTLREWEKRRNTFLEYDKGPTPLIQKGKLHPQYLLHRDYDVDEKEESEGACSGRLASKGPNIQNWEKEVRVIVQPDNEDMEVLSADYKQIEWRIIAWAAGGEIWKAVQNPLFDVHRKVAARVYGKGEDAITKEERGLGKRSVYAGAYLVGPLTFSRRLAKDNIFLPVADCKKFLDGFHALFPAVKAKHLEWFKEAAATGKVTNPFGRYRRFLSPEREQSKITNIYPQSTAGDIILRAMARLRRELPTNVGRVAIQVHDDLTLFTYKNKRKEAVECLRDCMEVENSEMPGFKPEIDLSAGPSWGELKTLA